MSGMNFDTGRIARLVELALEEDLGGGDPMSTQEMGAAVRDCL